MRTWLKDARENCEEADRYSCPYANNKCQSSCTSFTMGDIQNPKDIWSAIRYFLNSKDRIWADSKNLYICTPKGRKTNNSFSELDSKRLRLELKKKVSEEESGRHRRFLKAIDKIFKKE